MRDRLIKLICNCPSKIMGANMFCEKISVDLADCLLANGVFVPPCKVGDILYEPCQCFGRNVIVEYVVIAIQSSIRDEWIVRYKKIGSTVRRQCFISDIGKTIFLSKKEAKASLTCQDFRQVEKGGAE